MSSFLRSALWVVVLCCVGCAREAPRDAPRDGDVSSVAPQPAKNKAQSADKRRTLPALPAAPSLRVEVISGPGSRALPLPEAPGDARFDIWEAVRGGEQNEKIMLVMRPGDVRAVSTDEGATWQVVKTDLSMSHVIPGVKMWWATGKLDERQRATRILESSDGGRSWRIKPTDNNLSPEPRLFAKHERALVLATGNDLLWSKDLGGTWKFVSPNINQTITAFHNHKGTWWLGGEAGAVAYGTSPRRWKHESLPSPVTIRQLAFAADGRIFAATDAGLWVRELADVDPADDDPKNKNNTAQQATWSLIPISAQRRLQGVQVHDNGNVIAFGEQGRVIMGLSNATLWSDATDHLRQALKLKPLASVTWRKALSTQNNAWLLFGDDAAIVRVSL